MLGLKMWYTYFQTFGYRTTAVAFWLSKLPSNYSATVITLLSSIISIYDSIVSFVNKISTICLNQRLPGACNRSPGSKLLSITTQLHCGGHLGGRAWLSDTILEEDHPMTIPSKFGSNRATGSRQDSFYVNFP